MENETFDVGGAVMRMQQKLGEALWLISVLEDRLAQYEGQRGVATSPAPTTNGSGSMDVSQSGLLASSD